MLPFSCLPVYQLQELSVYKTMGLAKASALLPLLASVLAPAAASELVWDSTEKPLVGSSHHFDKAACPDYANYAAYPQ